MRNENNRGTMAARLQIRRTIAGFVCVPLGVALLSVALFLGTDHGPVGTVRQVAAATTGITGGMLIFVVGRRLLSTRTERI